MEEDLRGIDRTSQACEYQGMDFYVSKVLSTKPRELTTCPDTNVFTNKYYLFIFLHKR